MVKYLLKNNNFKIFLLYTYLLEIILIFILQKNEIYRIENNEINENAMLNRDVRV